MIEELCRNIYNAKLKLNCELSSTNCLCPEKSAYEYLCYQCYLTQKGITEEDYALQLNRESGEIAVCHEFEKEISCSSVDWTGYQIINIIVDNVKEEIEKMPPLPEKYKLPVVELVALAMTQAAMFRTREVSYVNMVSAYKTEQFINHFLNLVLVIMQCMQGKAVCDELLDELSQCIEDINIIYENRSKIGEQFCHYQKLICKGLEGTKYYIGMEQTFLRQQDEINRNKQNADSLTKFMFCCIDTDGKIVEHEFEAEFISVCVILKKYLKSYQEKKQCIEQETYKRILLSLGRFSDKEDIDIHSIEGLKQLDLESSNAWAANAKIIFDYLQGIRRTNLIVAYNLTSI